MIELACIPSSQTARIESFVAGAKATLRVTTDSGSDPMKVEPEFRDTGNCHIWLVTGRWELVDGEPVEVFRVLPWEE